MLLGRAAHATPGRIAPPPWKWAFGRLIPRRIKPALHAVLEYARPSCDPELRIVRSLCEPTRCSIDVGAMLGYYTWWLQLRSAHDWAFEPHPELHDKLRRGFGRKVTVLPFALSDFCGSAELFLSFSGAQQVFGCSSLEPDVNAEYTRAPIRVEVRRIDDIGIANVGFIKIQAEGHEARVLAGAIKTIARDRPTLLVALQERHRPGIVAEVDALLQETGYRGWFIWDDALVPIASFSPELHQKQTAVPRPGDRGRRHYAFWFFFFPNERREIPRQVARRLRSAPPHGHRRDDRRVHNAAFLEGIR